MIFVSNIFLVYEPRRASQIQRTWIDHQECYPANESLSGARNTADDLKQV